MNVPVILIEMAVFAALFILFPQMVTGPISVIFPA